VENRIYPADQTPAQKLTLYIDPELKSDQIADSLGGFQMCPYGEASLSLLKKGNRLWVNYPDGEFCDFPLYEKNIIHILNSVQAAAAPSPVDVFSNIFKSIQALEKKIFSNVANHSLSGRYLWDEIIKKINTISGQSHSLNTLVEKVLEVPFLQSFQSSLIILHLKGQTKAEILGTIWKSEKIQRLIEVKDFNQFFNSIKKSKIKSFSSEAFPRIDFPFNGSFLAKEVVSQKYSLVAMVSRHDFLSCSKQEIELFETCIDLLQPHFERLIEQEFSDKKMSELRICLKDFPLPIRVKDSTMATIFVNDLFTDQLQDQDIFFSKKVIESFNLDLYDSDDLRHYAFDLFHFQRISLLGELLNTLRHELSNPLFGLKLGSQIFQTLEVAEDSSDIMREIAKNVSRCQEIIENFSNLYGVETVAKPVALKKIIDESMILAKSEVKGIRKSINYQAGTGEILLNAPLIFVVQIIFNLLVNSAQAMQGLSSTGQIEINVKGCDNEVQIDVIDNGPGIPADKISSLFKPFFTTKSQGTGLGLLLSRNLALKMGGKLEYLENNLNTGAQFRLTLPIL
jgi:two-component system, NtrC family, sensor kinase